VPTEEELEILSRKLTQLKLAYDQYFLGSRPREPGMLRDEVAKLVVVFSNQAIQNTAMRFKFGSICSRYQAFKRQWTETLRKIEAGTYERHQFKANLHRGGTRPGADEKPAPAGPKRSEVYDAYLEARRACGQNVDELSPAKLDAILDKQESALRGRFGDVNVRFRVVVEDGKAKLKASRA
jgi:hypothetical protein